MGACIECPATQTAALGDSAEANALVQRFPRRGRAEIEKLGAAPIVIRKRCGEERVAGPLALVCRGGRHRPNAHTRPSTGGLHCTERKAVAIGPRGEPSVRLRRAAGGALLRAGKWRLINGRRGVVAAGLSALLALGLAHIIADIWARPRPYVAHPGATFHRAVRRLLVPERSRDRRLRDRRGPVPSSSEGRLDRARDGHAGVRGARGGAPTTRPTRCRRGDWHRAALVLWHPSCASRSTGWRTGRRRLRRRPAMHESTAGRGRASSEGRLACGFAGGAWGAASR